MVTVKLQARCMHCDYEDLEMSTVEGEEDMVICPYCRGTAPLSALKESVAQQLERFKAEGLSAVVVNKNRYFG